MNEELSFKSQMCLKNAMGSQVRGREAGGADGRWAHLKTIGILLNY